MKERSIYFQKWNKFKHSNADNRTAEEFLFEFFPKLDCFQNYFGFKTLPSFEIPSYLIKHSDVEKVLHDESLLREKASIYSNESTSEILTRLDNSRNKLESIFQPYSQLIQKLRTEIVEKLLSIDENFESYNDLDRNDFKDLVYCLSEFYKNVSHGSNPLKEIENLGNLPITEFGKKLLKNSPKEFHELTREKDEAGNSTFDKLSENEKQSLLKDFCKPIQQKRKKELKNYLVPIVDHLLVSDDLHLMISYKAIKNNEPNDREVLEQSLLYQIEQIQEKSTSIGIDFLTLQYLSNKSTRIEEQVNRFLEGFNSEYKTEIIDKYIRFYFTEKRKSMITSKIIERFEGKHKKKFPEITEISRGTFDNWIKRFENFISE